MTQRNVRGCYMNFEHDRAADWDWLSKWQPNVIRYMAGGQWNDPASFDVNRVRRIHETCPDATILLRCWEIDDNNFKAHDAMVSDPRGTAEHQVDWWSKVFDRAVLAGVPRAQLMAGLNNETGPEKDAALYDYTRHALEFAVQRNVRLGVYVFSVGRPALPGDAPHNIDTFSQLDAAILANQGAVLLHQYMQPEGMYAVWTDEQGNERKDWTYLMGRDLRWSIKSPIIIAEWGIDGILYNRHPDPKYGNSGWRNFKKDWPPSRYADEYVECVRQASDNVIGICPFISDFSDHKWQSFDLLDAYGEFLARKDLCVKTATKPPIDTHLPVVGTGPQPPTGPTALVSAPNGANIRIGPGLEFPVDHAEQKGVSMPVTGRNGEGDWWQVQTPSGPGWVYGMVVQTANVANVPVVDSVPPVEQPKPTGNDWPRIYAFIKRWEGGFVDHPNDPGGATNKGVTFDTFKRWRDSRGQGTPTIDDLRNLTDAEAEQIFYEWYYKASFADTLPWPLNLAQADTAVNAGVGKAKEMLQRSGGNFVAYMGHLIKFYAGIDNFEHFGRGWINRRGDLMIEASK